MTRPQSPRTLAVIAGLVVLSLGLLLYLGARDGERPGEPEVSAPPPLAPELASPTAGPTERSAPRQGPPVSPAPDGMASEPGPMDADEPAPAPEEDEPSEAPPTFPLFGEDGSHGPAFDEVDRLLGDCLRTWPASEPRLFHMRRYSMSFEVGPPDADGLSTFSNVDFDAFIGEEETQLDSSFFVGCVAGGLEDLRVTGAPTGTTDRPSFSITGSTDFDVYEQIERLFEDPEALAATGMTLGQLEELEAAIREADPDR